MIKLVKTGPDGLIEHSRPEPRTPADRGTNVPRPCRAYHPRPAKSTADPTYRPGRHRPAVGQPLHTPPSVHDRAAREQEGKAFAAARHNPCTAADPSADRKHRPVTGQTYPSVHRPNTKTIGHDRSDVPMADTTRRPADRPDRPSERRGRPEAVFEAQSHNSSPKPAPT
ncbi:unnamed protein product [Microthlaspi erraticum]|uniref:Uncharacterized protein n=1 Tax=Microthlaspi erraticum TaxID=1685480 RepID=A0A6D2JSM2_9BRAS|nr:unnamed protein product [Microthlaspi erraticum]